MATAQRQIVKVRIQLVAYSATETWIDLSPFIPTYGITKVRGRTVLCDKTGTFSFRVGIQTYLNDPEFPDAPTAPTTGTGLAAVTTLVKNMVDFDPNLAAPNGDIDTKAGFRLGAWYSATGGALSRGDVIIELFVDA